MTLHVYEWFSYACNNSSDHRLVAEFETGPKAAAMAKELAAVFLANAKQAEAAADEEGEWDPWDLDPSPALVAFAKKYGTKFDEGLIWGDDGAFTEDLPEIATLGNKVYVYHGYMSGGFDGDLPRVLKKAGAKSVAPESGPSWVKFTAKAKAKKVGAVQAAVDALMGQRRTTANLCDWKVPWKGRLPISKKLENAIVIHDDAGTTFTLAIGAAGIPKIESWLRKVGAEQVDVQLVTDKDLTALRRAEDAAVKAAQRGATVTDGPGFDARGRSFLFTGKLASMSRDEAKKRVSELSGKIAGSVTNTLDVLVIGDEGSPLYGDGAKGDKQRKAEELIAAGAGIRIISESAFLELGSSSARAPSKSKSKK